MAGILSIACNLQGFETYITTVFLIRKTFFQYPESFSVSRIMKMVWYSKTIFRRHVWANNSRILIDLCVVSNVVNESRRENGIAIHCIHNFKSAVLPCLLANISDEDNLSNEVNSSSISHTGKSKSDAPKINRHNKRELNGCFTKTLEKCEVVEAMIAASPARSLGFENNDEPNDENEPLSKRQTRNETVLFYTLQV